MSNASNAAIIPLEARTEPDAAPPLPPPAPGLPPTPASADRPPEPADCPCWRVFNDWWKDGKSKRRPGVYHHETEAEKDGAETATNAGKVKSAFLCGPLHVIATTSDHHGASFGKLLYIRDTLGDWHTWNMPSRLLGGDGSEVRRELLDLGLNLPHKARCRLFDYLDSQHPKTRIQAATQAGWAGQTFVLPDRAYGPGSGAVFYQSEDPSIGAFETAGTLEQWRAEVAAMAPGNLGLTLAISAALAGPLLALAHVEHLGLHLIGESSTGKTTALQAGASVWGGPGFVRTWKATGNGLEAAAVECNDTLLCLDEIGEADRREIGAVVYALANGRGKSRAKVTGRARRVARFRTVVLSTGEKTLDDHQREAGYVTRAGQDVRLLNIAPNCEHGAFDALHQHETGRHLADHIKTACGRSYGHAGRAFLERITGQERPDVAALLAGTVERFNADGGQESRAARQLALLAVAGELASWRPRSQGGPRTPRPMRPFVRSSCGAPVARVAMPRAGRSLRPFATSSISTGTPGLPRSGALTA